MSKIDELIEKLCPNGVEYSILNTICNIYDGTHQTPKYKASGIKFVSVENIQDLYATNKYISEEDYNKYKIKPQKNDILMTRIGKIGECTVIDSDEPLAYYVSLALLRANKDVLNSKFLKYYIESRYGSDELLKRTLIKAIPIKINLGDIGKISIPVPPLEIQCEIVRILDKFSSCSTELIALLKAELKARKQQYEYYREKLLTFEENIHTLTFEEACILSSGGDIKKSNVKSEMNELYNIPVYSNGTGTNALYGYTNIAKVKAPCITISARGTIGYCALREKDFYPIVRLICVKPKIDVLNIEYLMHYIKTIRFKLPTSGIPQLTIPMLKSYKIPIPPLDVQRKIAKILNKFEKLTNDLTEGIPAEIEARQKQYEYYRDKLLTFKELEK